MFELGSAWGKIDIDYSGVQNAASASRNALGSIGSTTKKAFGGMAAGVGAGLAAVAGGAANVSMQTQTAAADIQASMGVSQKAAEEFASVARTVYGNNFAGSVTEAGAAVEAVAKQLNLAASDPSMQTITERALALEDTFGVGVADSVDAAQTLMDNFGLSSTEAFDMLAGGYQMGMDRSGDFLATIGEYSVQFSEGGANASQFFSMLESGMAGGMLGTDKAADAFKEFRLRIQDGSDSTSEALAAIGLDADAMAAGFQNGSLDAIDAFTMVQSALKNTDDENVRFQAGVALMGSQFEDLGQKAILGMDPMALQMSSLSGAADSLNAKYNTMGAGFAGMWRQVTVAAAPAMDVILQAAQEAMPALQSVITSMIPVITMLAQSAASFMGVLAGWLEGFSGLNPQMQAVILGAGGLLTALVPLGMAIGPIVTVVTTLGSVLAALASPIVLIGALVGGLLAVLFDWGGANEAVASTLEGWGLEGVANGVRSLHEGVSALWETVQSLLSGETTFADVFGASLPDVSGWLSDVTWPSLPDVGTWLSSLNWPTLPSISEWLTNITWPELPDIGAWLAALIWPGLPSLTTWITTLKWPGLPSVTEWLENFEWPGLPDFSGIFDGVSLPGIGGFGKNKKAANDAPASASVAEPDWLDSLTATPAWVTTLGGWIAELTGWSWPEFGAADTISGLVEWSWPHLGLPDWAEELLTWAWPLLGPVAWAVKLTSWAWPKLPKPSWIQDLLNFKWPKLPSLPGWMGGGGGDVGENAAGTPFWRGGLTWVGEDGPELIELPIGTRIHDNPSSMAMASGMGPVTINITTGPINSELDLDRALRRAMNRLQIVTRYG